MDAERRDEVTDASLDRELTAMLAVNPSPEFVARVRTRIADEPSRSHGWFGQWTIAASIGAVAALAIVVFVFTREGGSNVPSASPVLGSRTVTLSGSPLPDVKAQVLGVSGEPAPAIRRTHAPAQHASAQPQPAEPEILIDRREAAALRALIFGTRDGRVDLAPLLDASPPSVMELPPIVDIEIPAITIDPIAPGPGEEGVRQ